MYRRKGFLDAVQDSDAEIIEIPVKMNRGSGYQAGESIINAFSRKENPSAAFAANDWLAIGFIQRLIEARIKIPQDISLIGCDDIPLANEIVPKLTTFRWDFKYFIKKFMMATFINKLHALILRIGS